MTILVTGADGFVGRHLVRILLATCDERLVLLDKRMPAIADPRVTMLSGDIADEGVRDAALTGLVTCVYHLAAVPGGMAEREPDLSRRVNRDATIALAERAAAIGACFVNASTIAVLGTPDGPVDDGTPPRPEMVYGRHKGEAEQTLAALKGTHGLQASTVRLPGIVARPPVEAGLKSAFLSEVFHGLRASRPFVCPVSAEATTWLMSVGTCVENLIHAARPETVSALGGEAVTLPALRVRMGDLVEAIATACHADPALVTYAPDPALEAVFGRLPPLATDRAEGAGFRRDGSLTALVVSALDHRHGEAHREVA